LFAAMQHGILCLTNRVESADGIDHRKKIVPSVQQL
jgi:hypothetical protein